MMLPPPRWLHARHGELGGVQQPGEIGTDQGVPPPGVRLGEGLPKRAPDHVDQDVAPVAEAGVRSGEELRQRIGIAGVELGGHHLTSGIGQHCRHFVQRSSIPVAQRQVHTGAAEIDGTGAADAAPAAHHDGHPAGQVGPIIEIAHGAPLSLWSCLRGHVCGVMSAWSCLRGHVCAKRERRSLRSSFPKSVMGSSVSTKRRSGCLKLAMRPWQN